MKKRQSTATTSKCRGLRTHTKPAAAAFALCLMVWAQSGPVIASSAAPTHGGKSAMRSANVGSGRHPLVTVTFSRWRLPSALSRAGAAPLRDGRILLFGGLLSTGASSAEAAILDTSNGAITPSATLASPTHDAGYSDLGPRAFVFGGGESTPFALVESVALPGATRTTAGVPLVTGQLPEPRADCAAATIGDAAYVIGGYNGSTGDATVLMTVNGSSFSPVVTLPVAVRYPAVTVAKGRIYVFGGQAEPGGSTTEYSTPGGSTTPPLGQQAAVVQEIDPRTKTATVVAQLPHALQGAAAFTLDGHIFLAGGDSYPPGASPMSGSTVWSFDPASRSFHVAGHLAAPVAYAAVAAEGRSAWLVGGERDGAPVASAQRIALARHPGGGRRR